MGAILIAVALLMSHVAISRADSAEEEQLEQLSSSRKILALRSNDEKKQLLEKRELLLAEMFALILWGAGILVSIGLMLLVLGEKK